MKEKIITIIASMAILIIFYLGYTSIMTQVSTKENATAKVELLACYSKLAHYQP